MSDDDKMVSFDEDIEDAVVNAVADEMEKQDVPVFPASIHITLANGRAVRYSAPSLSDFDGHSFVITEHGQSLLNITFSERIK